jgi:hypothetical protein
MRRAVKPLLLCLAIACLCVAGLGTARASEYHGQVTFGGLPVPGAVVTATQGDKKVVAIADPLGLYSFPNLADGAWTIEVQMTGFAPAKQDVSIAPATAAGAFELKLMTLEQIRAAANPMKVDAAAVAVASAAVPGNTSGNTSLPAAPGSAGNAAAGAAGGAAAAAAAATAPGTAAAATPGKAGTKGKGAATGGAATGGATPAAPQQASAAAAEAPDAVAQQANDGLLINGSVNNAATSQYALSQAFGNNRSGRSLYNGGFSLVLDNSALDASKYSVSGDVVPNPSFNNFQAGVNVGGPLKIPRLLPLPRAPYVYLSYQRAQQNTNSALGTVVPTAAELSGDFSQPVNGVVQTIYVPPASQLPAGCVPGAPSGAAFPNNKIPNTCINSTSLALLGFYPAPNATSTGSPDNYQAVTTNDSRQDAFSINAQKQFGSKNNLNGYFRMQSTRSTNTSLFGFQDLSDALGMGANVGWYHRFTQRMSMNAGYNFTRQRTLNTPFFANRENVEGGGVINGVNAGAISGVDTDPNYWGPPGLGFSTSLIAGLSDGSTSNNRSETNAINAALNWNKFRHNVQIGGDFRRQESNVFSQANPRGSLGFTGFSTESLAQQTCVAGQANNPTCTFAPAGFDLADMLLGLPDTSSISYGNADKYYRQSIYDLYANDDFRVNPELSVNAGVRWEYGAPVTELKNRLVTLDTGTGFATATPVVATNPGSLPTSLVQPDKIGIAPNVGIAWRPISGSSLLIRSGYQINHETSVYMPFATQMATQTGATPATRSLSISNGPNCSFNINSPFPSCTSTSSAPTPIAQQFAIDPNFRVGYVQIWYVSAQRDLPLSLQMLATYRGTKGTRGQQQILPNTYAYGATDTCPSCPFGYAYRTSNGNSTREEGVLTLRRRLRSGLTANLTYTYSKSIDDDYQMGGSGGTGVNPQVAQDWHHPEAQRGLSTFDQRNVLSFSAQYTTGMGIGGKTLLSGWRGAAYKEWTVLTSITAASGLPETPSDPLPVPNTSYSGIFRASYAGGPVTGSPKPGFYLNPNAFVLPASGQFGNARRDSIPGPDQFTMNASLARTFRLHDRYTLDAHLDANNVLNHVAYTGWVNTVGTPQYGFPANAGSMRSMQITMRLRF